MRALKSFLAKLQSRAFAPVDIASLVFFRIAFGLLMVWEVWRYFAHGWIASRWLEPRFLFKYYGFFWVHPWPGNWLYIHWVLLGVLALFVAAGFFYRITTTLFFLSYTYFFLLDEALYVNHTYLICLFALLLVFVPANRAVSVDAWLKPKIRSETTPAWTLWLLRAQMAVVYFYGGVAKISPDWLRGEPMRTRNGLQQRFPNPRPVFSGRMGRLRGELRWSFTRSTCCAAPFLASHTGRGFLCCVVLSSYQRTLVVHRRLSVAGDFGHGAVSLTKLAAKAHRILSQAAKNSVRTRPSDRLIIISKIGPRCITPAIADVCTDIPTGPVTFWRRRWCH